MVIFWERKIIFQWKNCVLKWDALKRDGLTLKQTCLTSPLHMQWVAKNPITEGTIYKRAGWNRDKRKRKRG